MDNKITIKDSFEMPAVDDTVNVIVSKSIGLTPECWIWNDSVGYLKVKKFSLYDNQVTLENVGRIENAKAGTLFPSCMEFLITAPAPIDLYNSMSTCLKADFNSPSVGNEALMSVESSYAISVDDQVIIDRTYRYLVTQVVNSTTLKVKNEGLGATGIIHVDCNECTPVQVVNQLNCCPIPTGELTSNTSVLTVTDGADVLLDSASLTLDTDLSQYDNSVTQFIDVTGVPRGTLSSNSNLVSVTNGTNNVLDNISLDLDTDLSKYNNTTSGYITLGDVPRGTLSSNETILTVTNGTNNVLDNISLDLDTDLSKYDNSTSEFLATTDKKDLTSNTTVLTVTNGTGTTLENTSLTLDTDLSKYDNTTSSFVASSDKKDLTSTTPILTVTNGTGATLENTTVSLNTDLSQYDNSVSQFVSAGGLASGTLSSNSTLLTVNNGTDSILTNVSLDLDDDLSHYDNSISGFITSSSLPIVNDAKLTIYQSDGVTPFVEFTANASSAVTATLPASGGSYTATAPISIDANNDISISQATTSTDGYLSSTDWNTFNNKSDGLQYFKETVSGGGGTSALFIPDLTSGKTAYILGANTAPFNVGYINDVHSTNTYTTNLNINDITHSEVANIIIQTANFDFSNIVGVSNLWNSTHTVSTDTISISNSYSHAISCLIDVDMLITRLRITQDSGTNQTDIQFFGYIEIINITTSNTNSTTVSEWYSGRVLNTSVSGNGWYEICPTFTYTNKITLAANCSYKIRAYAVLQFPGGSSNVTAKISGGVNQHGYIRIAMIVQ